MVRYEGMSLRDSEDERLEKKSSKLRGGDVSNLKLDDMEEGKVQR